MSERGLIGILHPVLITGDFERTLAFYRDVMGFVPRPVTQHDTDKLRRLGGPSNAVAQAVILHAPDGSELEIASFTSPRGKSRTEAGWPDAGIRSITFTVREMQPMLERLADAGCELVNEVVEFLVEGNPVQVAYVNGPDGVVLTLVQEGR